MLLKSTQSRPGCSRGSRQCGCTTSRPASTECKVSCSESATKLTSVIRSNAVRSSHSPCTIYARHTLALCKAVTSSAAGETWRNTTEGIPATIRHTIAGRAKQAAAVDLRLLRLQQLVVRRHVQGEGFHLRCVALHQPHRAITVFCHAPDIVLTPAWIAHLETARTRLKVEVHPM